MGLIPDSEHVTCISLYFYIDSEYGLDGLTWCAFVYTNPIANT